MATKNISDLTPADTLTGSEIIPVVQAGTTKKATPDQIADLIADTILAAETTASAAALSAANDATTATTKAAEASASATAASDSADAAAASEAAVAASAAAAASSAAEAQAAADVVASDGTTQAVAYAGDAAALPGAPAGYRKVVIGGVSFVIPYWHHANVVDLFVVVGQSNAEGRGDSSLSPAAPNGRYISGSTITSPLADPVGGASTGSMWPAFSNEWYMQTGRLSAFVEAATGGTALLPNQSGTNWSPLGSLRAAAASAANTAIAAINSSAQYALGNVYFVWSQGEQDAANGATEADYEAALEALAAYFKAQVPSMMSMCVVQTGVDLNNPSQIAQYAAIRKAQDDACADSANLTMGYRGTHSFWAALPIMAAGGVHYTQAGYNLAGKCAARELAVGPSAIPSAPAVLSATAYPDTAYATSGSHTESHTTSAGTHGIIVAAAIMRPDAATSFQFTGATFGGVSMTKVGEIASAGTGYIRVALFRLDETAYGGSLDGVTANVVVTSASSATNIIDFCVFDCDKAGIADFIGTYNPSPANVASGSTTATSNAPALWITIGASAGASATPLTATFTGATEVMDHGLANGGATRTGQVAVGYSSEAITVNKSVTINWGTSCDTMAIATFVLRGKIDGE